MNWNKILKSFIVALLLVSTIFATTSGENVKFEKTVLEGSIINVQYMNKQVVVVLTDENFYVSIDSGHTFQGQNVYLGCDNQKKNCVSRMITSPADPNTVILVGSSGDEHYVSSDLTNSNPSLRYHKFKFPAISSSTAPTTTTTVNILPHPIYKKYYLALVNTNKNQQQLNNLYVSKDSCRTWSMIKDNIRQAVWSNHKASKHNNDAILAIKAVPAADYKALFKYDIVSGSTSDDIVTGAHDIFHMGQYTFLSTRTSSSSSTGGGYSLFVSTDNGLQFRKAQLPDNEASSKAYVLLDNSEGSIFLNVVENDKSNTAAAVTAPYGTVYVSDWSGSRYSHSLLNNHVIHPSAGQNKADFHRIKAMEGVYVSNVIAEPNEECTKCTNDCHKKCLISSRITFNRGGFWQQLEAPTVDSAGKPTKSGSHLHLRGIQVASTSPIQSDESAVGLILATGNTGKRLSKNNIANTFLSRDAGLTWTEVSKGSHTYDITENGALIVMAPDVGMIKNVTYSWNHGITWNSVQFTNDADLSIEKISHNPKDPLTRTVLLQGIQGDSSVLISADFSTVSVRDCVGYDKPGTAESDYEYFIPHTYQNNQCLLGRVVQYVRKKKDTICFNKYADKAQKIRNCKCTTEDYECDYYHVRKMNGDKLECVPSDAPEARDQIEKMKLPPRRCYGYYNETRGYRKVAGNTCQDGIDLAPVLKQCPSSVSSLGIFILVIFFSLLFAFIGLFLYRHSHQFQSMVRSASKFTSQSVVQYSQISQSEEFGLDDHEDDDEPDEFDSTFNFSAVTSLNQPITPSEDIAEDGMNLVDQSNARTVSLDADPLTNRRL